MKFIIPFLVIISVFLAACGSDTEVTGAATEESQLERMARLQRIYDIDPQKEQEGRFMTGLVVDDLVTGKSFTLEDLNEKIVIVETFSVGCDSCIKGIGEYNVLYDKYDGKIEFVYLGMNEFDSAEDILATKEEFHGRDWIWTEFTQDHLDFFDEYNIYANDQTFILDHGQIIGYADSFKTPVEVIDEAIAAVI